MKLWKINDRIDGVAWGYIITNSDKEELELEEMCRHIGEATDYEFDMHAEEIELKTIDALREEFSYELGE